MSSIFIPLLLVMHTHPLKIHLVQFVLPIYSLSVGPSTGARWTYQGHTHKEN